MEFRYRTYPLDGVWMSLERFAQFGDVVLVQVELLIKKLSMSNRLNSSAPMAILHNAAAATAGLQSVGIPYETEEGFADLHAAGRHSHITGLLQNGATLTQARELARHGDIRMTMRYTHIGIDDQAAALAGLPVPASSALPQNAGADQRISSAPIDSPWQSVSFVVDSGLSVSAKENPCGDKGYLQKSPSDGECHKWRRRESNPQPVVLANCVNWPAIQSNGRVQ